MKKKALAFVFAFVFCFCCLSTAVMSPLGEDEHTHVHAAGEYGTPTITISAESEVDHNAKTVTLNIKIKGSYMAGNNLTDLGVHASRGLFNLKYDNSIFTLSSVSGQFMGGVVTSTDFSNDIQAGEVELLKMSESEDFSISSLITFVFSFSKVNIAALSDYNIAFSGRFSSMSSKYSSGSASRTKDFSVLICPHTHKTEIHIDADCRNGERMETVCEWCGESFGFRYVNGGNLGPHKYDYESIRVVYNEPSTCTTSGVKMKCVCKICGQWVEVTDLEYHKSLDTSKKLYDPQTKKFYYLCSDGHHVIAKIQPTPPIEHSTHEWIEVEKVAATCSAAGHVTYACLYGGESKTEEIPKLEHSFGQWVTVKAATCTEAGISRRTCSKCRATEDAPIEKTGHTFGEWKVVNAATCVKEGLERRTCSKCGATEDRAIGKSGHQPGDWTISVEPTCTAAGKKHIVCTLCGAELEVASVEALGHDFGEWEILEASSCIKEGLKRHTCSRCGLVEEVVSEKEGHLFGEWEIITEPTCTEAGKKQRTCTLCGEETEVETIEPLGHDFGMWQVTKEATCLETGTMVRVCSRCGEKEEREMETDETLHKYVKTTVKESSCYDAGLVEYICSICGAKDASRAEVTPATGHNFVSQSIKNPNEKTCSHCGLVVIRNDSAKEPNMTIRDGSFKLYVDISENDPGDVWF